MKILLSSIESIKVRDTRPTYSWGELRFKPYKRFLGIVTQRAGWYNVLGDYEGQEYPKDRMKSSYPKGNVGYYKPCVEITTLSENIYTKYFDTLEEAKAYASSIDVMVDRRTIEI